MSQTDDLKALYLAKLPDVPTRDIDQFDLRACFDATAEAIGTGGPGPDPNPDGDFVGTDIRLFRYKVGTVEDASDAPFNQSFSNGISSITASGLIGWDVTFVVVSDASGTNVIKREPSGFQTNKTTGTIYFGSVLNNAAVEVLARKLFTAGDPGSGGVVPTTPLTGTSWNLSTDGTHKSITITGDTTITVTIADGEEGNLLVTGAGVVTIAGTDITTIANGKTIIVVKRMGSFTGAKGIDFPAPNVTPPAPTNGVVDDTANTFTFTNAVGYVATDHEYRISSGSWTALSSNTINIGNTAVAIGALEVRVKAAAGRNAGPSLTNQTAFTTTSGGATVVRYTSLTGIAETSTNSNVWQGSGTNIADQFAVDANHAIASGTDVIYYHELTGAATQFAFLYLNDSATPSAIKDLSGTSLVNYYVGYAPGYGDINYGGRNATEQTFAVTLGAGNLLGLRVSGPSGSKVVQAVYSTNGGTSWQVAGTITGGIYPTVSMYPGCGMTLPGGKQVNQPRFV